MAAKPPETATAEPWYCAYPFLVAQLNPGGKVHACCANWIEEDPGCYGEVTNRSLAEVWNSERAREFRRSIVDQSYRYCRLGDCALYRDPGSDIRAYGGGLNGKVLEEFLQDEQASVLPVELFLQYDTSCNLSCPSCRSAVHVAAGAELETVAAIQANVFDGALSPRKLALCGTGEALASPVLRDLLVNYTAHGLAGCELTLLTNGTLLDEAMYRRLSAAPWIEQINVSIDAATKSTFEQVRRGGRYETLRRNLEFYSRLLAAGKIKVFATSFTLQARNFKELYDFFDMCDGLGVTAIRVNTLMPVGEFQEPARYREQAVHLPDHPEFVELCRLLGATRFETQTTAYYSGAFKEIHRDPVGYARRWLAQREQEMRRDAAPRKAVRALRSRVESVIAELQPEPPAGGSRIAWAWLTRAAQRLAGRLPGG